MKLKKAPSARIALACLLCIAGAAHAQQPTYKIAYIDPLSGPFANVGELMLMHTQYAIEDINAKGGVLGGTKLQLLQFDSKLSAQESQSALQAAIDQGAKAIVTGGSGSSVVTALVQSVARWNQRNPGKELIVLNHSSIDPEMTGKGCSFWHFQTEANTAMKMKALANYIKKTPDVKKVYLLNQDYAHGKQWASYGRQMVGLARPDVQFVGEALHPIGRVKDFAPYIANIRQSGADSVITGNWGQDMTLLLKAAGDAGYNLRYFNHSAGSVPGTVTAVSQAKTGQLTWVAEWHPGQADTPKADALAKAYKAKTGKDFLAPRIDMTPRLLAAGHQQGRQRRYREGGACARRPELRFGGRHGAHAGRRPPTAAASGGEHHRTGGRQGGQGGLGRDELRLSHRCGLQRQRAGTGHRVQDGPALKALFEGLIEFFRGMCAGHRVLPSANVPRFAPPLFRCGEHPMPCALGSAAGVRPINQCSENEHADGVPCAAKSRRSRRRGTFAEQGTPSA
jgi:branched-chain amino acid transport system substrate-binding protein